MKARDFAFALAAAGAIGAAAYGWLRPVQERAPAQAAGAGPASDKRVLYWHDPMVPAQRFDRPGKSPYMDMQLVPVYAEDAAAPDGVAISPQVRQNLGIRTAEVVRSRLAHSVRAAGAVAWNERDVVLVQARSAGFVERLYVRASLDPVRKGQPLADLYVPDWVAAQEEYLALRNARSEGVAELLAAARQRMRLAGMTEDLVRKVESGGKLLVHLTLVAPRDGVVAELGAREGMAVSPGAPLFRINGVRTVWVDAELPETLSGQVRPGQPVEVRASAVPDAVLGGRVSAILPELTPVTRTRKARVELPNPDGRLVPGMLASVDFMPAAAQAVLSVPAEAVIRTGRRSVVILAEDGGRFRPVEVETGIEAEDAIEIRRGLVAGQRVVASGQFLIDSEANLKSALARMEGMPERPSEPVGQGGAHRHGAALHAAQGIVEAIGKDAVTLSHGPVRSLAWPAMTMDFRLPPGAMPAGIAVGDAVRFEFQDAGQGEFRIARLAKAADGAERRTP